jgi:hypothetical protein
MIDLDTVQSLTHCLFGLSVQQQDDRMGVSTKKAHTWRQTNNIIVHNSPSSSDTSRPMAPGQYSSVLSIDSQLVKPSQEYSITSSNRFRPLTPSQCATDRNYTAMHTHVRCNGLFICQLYSLPDLLEETDCKEDTPLTLPFASFVSLSQLIIVI